MWRDHQASWVSTRLAKPGAVAFLEELHQALVSDFLRTRRYPIAR